MAVCVRESAPGGPIVVVLPQPVSISTCTMVISSGPEILRNPLDLTIEQGHEIGLAIFLACAIAWGFRILAKVISTTDEGVS